MIHCSPGRAVALAWFIKKDAPSTGTRPLGSSSSGSRRVASRACDGTAAALKAIAALPFFPGVGPEEAPADFEIFPLCPDSTAMSNRPAALLAGIVRSVGASRADSIATHDSLGLSSTDGQPSSVAFPLPAPCDQGWLLLDPKAIGARDGDCASAAASCAGASLLPRSMTVLPITDQYGSAS